MMVRQSLIAASVVAVAGSIAFGPTLPTGKTKRAADAVTPGCRGYVVNGPAPKSCVLSNLVFGSRGARTIADWPKQAQQAKIVNGRPSDAPGEALAYFWLSPQAPSGWGNR